ncbi:hypothetical protein [Photobacterium kishitanii]|uniref:hypothetical protein n=1 Tax=Photobacterium kishitanii TaxID=318456 RepID=UPI000D17D1BB|nr:hypothetical protein [Photobacterium kishitanii]PSU20074.1 hypothetical protein CTM84_13870 [Photobacterium kishitanii]
MSNSYISYLNSLHNVSANGSNALAESQALSDFFSEVYEPFPIVQHVVELLTESKSRVVILTGHAGDGKSTVAIDVLKQLRGIPQDQKLSEPLKEREEIVQAHVNIVKDMSELSKEQRKQWLTEAFNELGSWLIVSNTGPLLDSLFDYAGNNNLNIESSVLDALNRPLEIMTTSAHQIIGFDKELVIINLTRLDNVHLGAKLVTKLVQHSGWTSCLLCDVNASCPIKKNRDVLFESLATVEERIRWIYARLTAYEHRLTLRQILAHIAFSLTGGESCEGVTAAFSSEGAEWEALQGIIFSETFFGLRAGRRFFDAESLHAISILQKEKYGSPVGVDFDSQLLTQDGMDWSILPNGLFDIKNKWSERAKDAKGARWRFALRRMNYIFGEINSGLEKKSELYIDSFLNSYGVRLFDQWKDLKQLDLKKSDRKKLNDLCLNVLLELFTGFNAYQYSSTGGLYLTLRRKDQNVVQPTQLVVEKFSFREFDIKYNSVICLPELVFRHNTVVLPLSLPLFDYIQARNRGELGSSLSPIYQSQIDWFQSELLRVTENEREEDDDEITVIKAGINGDVSIHHFLLDSEQGVLEIES